MIFVVRSSERSNATGGKNDQIGVDKTKKKQRHTSATVESVFLCLSVKVWTSCRFGVKKKKILKVLPIQHKIREFIKENFL